MTQQELEDRLLAFAANVAVMTKQMPSTFESMHLVKQIIRSSSSAALTYGEACSAESARDFVHKLSVGLKELRETRMNLRLILLNRHVTGLIIESLLDENDQLVRIFGKSINTVRRNRLKPDNG